MKYRCQVRNAAVPCAIEAVSVRAFLEKLMNSILFTYHNLQQRHVEMENHRK